MPTPTVRDVHVDRALSEFSIAYRNESYIFDQVFPVVKVQKKSDLYWIFSKSAWFRDEVGIRAPGTRSQEADYDLTSASYNALTYAIAKLIPDEVRENADNPLMPDVEGTEFVMDALLRAAERRVANLVMQAGSTNWSTANTPLGGCTWGVTGTASPDLDIEKAIDGCVSKIGRTPNVAVMSWPVWRNLRSHPNLVTRLNYSRAGTTPTPTLQDIKDWFGFDKILIGKSIYNNAKQGVTDDLYYIWGRDFWCGYVTPSPALMTPTAGYVLEWKNRMIKRFRRLEEYTDKIEASHSVDEVVTAADAGAWVGPVALATATQPA